MTRTDAEARARDQAKKKARALTKRFGISIEVVPAQEIASARATKIGSHYSVTVKRALNASDAFAFDYWGTAYEQENHVAPATHDVVKAALAVPSSERFFTPDERAAFIGVVFPAPLSEV